MIRKRTVVVIATAACLAVVLFYDNTALQSALRDANQATALPAEAVRQGARASLSVVLPPLATPVDAQQHSGAGPTTSLADVPLRFPVDPQASLLCDDDNAMTTAIEPPSSPTAATHCSPSRMTWFGRRREQSAATVGGGAPFGSPSAFVDTSLRLSEARALDEGANVTNNISIVAQHDAKEWRPHWKLRLPDLRWSPSRNRPNRDMPAEVLEMYETKRQHYVRSTLVPLVDADLEFITNVPPLYFFRRGRPMDRWTALQQEQQPQQQHRLVRIACLYAGFPRDVESMFQSCRDRRSEKSCRDPHVYKRYGGQRDNLVQSTNCDVFVSTWDIRGAGRYNTNTYDMTAKFDPALLHRLYGDRLAALHVQNFSEYQQLWRYLHKFSRPFPQTRPTKLHVDQRTGDSSFDGVPELNFLVRINDYSQSYKHWCVAHLALLSEVSYDIFYRLRFDLRSIGKLHSFRAAFHAPPGLVVSDDDPHQHAGMLLQPQRGEFGAETSEHNRAGVRAASFAAGAERVIAFRLDRGYKGGMIAASNTTKWRFVSSRRVHMNNFDIADFGFLGPPFLIEELSRLWYYCLAFPGSPMAPFDFAQVVSPESKYSEYNLMLWRIVFDNRWSVDSGGRYLWVSRYGQKR